MSQYPKVGSEGDCFCTEAASPTDSQQQVGEEQHRAHFLRHLPQAPQLVSARVFFTKLFALGRRAPTKRNQTVATFRVATSAR